jgi:hypothetical protein
MNVLAAMFRLQCATLSIARLNFERIDIKRRSKRRFVKGWLRNWLEGIKTMILLI